MRTTSAHDVRMSDHTDERPDDEDVDLVREDREALGDDDTEEPQPWAKTSSGDDD